MLLYISLSYTIHFIHYLWYQTHIWFKSTHICAAAAHISILPMMPRCDDRHYSPLRIYAPPHRTLKVIPQRRRNKRTRFECVISRGTRAYEHMRWWFLYIYEYIRFKYTFSRFILPRVCPRESYASILIITLRRKLLLRASYWRAYHAMRVIVIPFGWVWVSMGEYVYRVFHQRTKYIATFKSIADLYFCLYIYTWNSMWRLGKEINVEYTRVCACNMYLCRIQIDMQIIFSMGYVYARAFWKCYL